MKALKRMIESLAGIEEVHAETQHILVVVCDKKVVPLLMSLDGTLAGREVVEVHVEEIMNGTALLRVVK